MSATDIGNGQVDFHLEVQVIPVSDVDRARKFYERLGWRLDDDVAPMDGLHEKSGGRSHLLHRPGHEKDWPAWYAAYLVAEQTGTDLPA